MGKAGRFKFSEDDFRASVLKCKNWSEVQRELHLSISGSRIKLLKKLAAKLDLDTSHFLGQSWAKGVEIDVNKKWGARVKIEQFLVEMSPYNGGSNSLKRRILKEGLLEYKCELCNNDGTWNGLPLVLQLDHKNGINKDNRLLNLRLLCPNCHTQTSTFGAKKRISEISINGDVSDFQSEQQSSIL